MCRSRSNIVERGQHGSATPRLSGQLSRWKEGTGPVVQAAHRVARPVLIVPSLKKRSQWTILG